MTQNLVDAAITSRMSARAFTPQPVDRATITHLLEVASRAPSGTNTQPWKVYVLQGASRDSLVEMLARAGMKVILRQGSAWHDVAAQVKAVTQLGLDPRHFLLCTFVTPYSVHTAYVTQV